MKIPRYFSQVELPQYHFVPGETETERAWAGMSQAFEKVSTAGTQFLAEKRKLDESLEAANLSSEFRKRTETVETELKKNPNDETHVQDLSSKMSEIQTEILGKAKSENVRAALTRFYADYSASKTAQAEDFAFKTYLIKQGGVYAKTLFDNQQAYILADDSERARIRGEVGAVIRETASRLGKDPEIEMRLWDRESASHAASSDMELDAAGTKKKLMSGGYEGLWEQDRTTLIRRAEQMEKIAQVDAEKLIFDNAAVKLSKDYGQDYDTIFARLRDPDYQALYGITPEIKNKLENYFAAEKNRLDGEKKDKSDELAKNIFLDLKNTTTSQIDQAVRDGMDWRIGEHFKGHLINPPQGRGNLQQYFVLQEQILSNADPKQNAALLDRVFSADLNDNQKMALGGLVYREVDRRTDSATKEANQYLKNALIPKRSLTSPIQSLPEEEEDLYNAQQELKAIIQDQIAKKSPMKEEEIYAMAKTIAQRYQKPFAERLARAQIIMQEQGELMKSIAEWKKRAKKYKTPEAVAADPKLTYSEKSNILKYGFGMKSEGEE